MTKMHYLHFDNSLESFCIIKKESELLWENAKLSTSWGYQIQKDSKWKKGLSENELEKFQIELNLEFPEALKNFYRTMNGLDKPGINIRGDKEPSRYRSTFYSYPEDLELIKDMIDYTLEACHLKEPYYNSADIPRIFPYFGHRFLIFDVDELVLSMHGNDIIPWGKNLSKAICIDIFADVKYSAIDLNTELFWNKLCC